MDKSILEKMKKNEKPLLFLTQEELECFEEAEERGATILVLQDNGCFCVTKDPSWRRDLVYRIDQKWDCNKKNMEIINKAKELFTLTKGMVCCDHDPTIKSFTGLLINADALEHVKSKFLTLSVDLIMFSDDDFAVGAQIMDNVGCPVLEINCGNYDDPDEAEEAFNTLAEYMSGLVFLGPNFCEDLKSGCSVIKDVEVV